mmetsp:Transcript_14562/g.20773  ORF Transcript_14562/g.20773 Transcript_14562/m.20773 type:complete len:80 (+) Transcript_14562:361-600(+)
MATTSRLLSSNPEYSTTFITANKQYSFRKAFLSDPSTYPLLMVLGAAGGLVIGFSGYFITSSKDVQINPQTRASIIRPK